MNSPTTTSHEKTYELLLTTTCFFHHFQYSPEQKFLMQVLPGAPVIEALNSANCLLAAAVDLCDRMMENSNPNEIYGLRFLVEASKALVSAAVYSVEFGNRQGGAQ